MGIRVVSFVRSFVRSIVFRRTERDFCGDGKARLLVNTWVVFYVSCNYAPGNKDFTGVE